MLTDYVLTGKRSAKRAKGAFNNLAGHFGFARAMDITNARVTDYIDSRRDDGASFAMIRYELACLKRGLNLANEAGRLGSFNTSLP